MEPGRPELVIFARAPRIGAVKTRLAADIGDFRAWRVYRDLLRRAVRSLARDTRWRTVVALTPDSWAARGLPAIPVPPGVAFRAQGGGDLGTRMARAFSMAGPGPIVIVGCDVPGITARHIAEAFDALRSHEVVFGPAADGGYWLVGVRDGRRALRLFHRVRWSGPHALADTLANIPPHMRIAMLETLEDIDTGDDLARLARSGGAWTSVRIPLHLSARK